MAELYGTKCTCGCQGNSAELGIQDWLKSKFKEVHAAFAKAIKHVHQVKGFSPENLNDKPIKDLTEATHNVLKERLKPEVIHHVPAEMQRSLEQDVWHFSGMKTYTQMKEVSGLLLDETGVIKTLQKFAQDVQAIDAAYNEQYLEAEYQFATASAQMAEKWMQYAADGDGYNLQYRTAMDDKVRPMHQILEGITLPLSDSFWDWGFPPNGWRCRCNAIQVRKSKYEVSDSNEAMDKIKKATTQIGADGKNKGEIFRFNPGKQKKIFPPGNHYDANHCDGKLNVSGIIGMTSIYLDAENDKCKAAKIIDNQFIAA